MYGADEASLRAFSAVTVAARADELAVIRRTARAAVDAGQTRVLTFVGPSGVGKSTVIEHALRELTTEAGPGRFRVYRAGPGEAAAFDFASSSSLGNAALVTLLRSRFGITEGATQKEQEELIRAQVSEVLDDRKIGDVCFFLGQILDVPFPDSPLTKALGDDPQQMRLIRRSIIKSFFEADASRSPICLVFRDLDAAGEDSANFVSYLLEHLQGPILVVCSVRPELPARQPGWFSLAGGRHVRVDVGPVSDELAGELMRALLSPCEGGPPPALVEAGVRLCQGNVGLLRAMVQIFHDSGVLEDVGMSGDPVWRVHEDKLAGAQLPVTVDDTVSMRLAALSARESALLEHAAAMGSAFWVGALVALERASRKTPAFWQIGRDSEIDSIESVLGSLEQRDYVKRSPSSSFPGEVQYSFQHKLERQRFRSLTAPEARQKHHRTIADWLEHRQPERPTREHLVLLAFHLDHAGAKVQAGLLYLDAADGARASYALRVAEEYYARGLGLLAGAESRRRMDALHHHGSVLATLGRIDEALGAFREMLELAHQLDLRAKGGAAHNRIGRLYRALGSLDEARRHLETALSLFESVSDERGVAACHDDVGMLLWTRGEYEPALERLQSALEMRKGIGDARSIALSTHNIGVVLRDHGRVLQAKETLESALSVRREIGDLVGVAQTLEAMGRLAQDQSDFPRARDLFQEAYDSAREIAERNWNAVVLSHLAEIHFRLGDGERASELAVEAAGLCDEHGDKLRLAEANRGLAATYLMQGDLKRARTCIKYAVDLFGQIRSKSHLASALRTLGEVTGAGAWGPAHEGKSIDYFMRSIALCKEIGNEIEIAKSYRSFSDYVAISEHYKKNEQIQNEAKKLRAMSDDIFRKQGKGPERAAARG